MSPTSLYVHVPFCVVKCGYCDFNSYVPEGGDALDRFLAGLARELEIVDVPRKPVSVFIGGGTPTYLDPERLSRMFEILGNAVSLSSIAEITMEANPESVTVEKARIARAAGVTRVSLGGQTFDRERLAFLDRAHSAEQTEQAVHAMREGGFDNLSLDLMFGLPGQRPEEWERDLERALSLEPDHLSCYNLTFESGTVLERERRAGRVVPNEPERDAVMFRHTRERLADAGYRAYEVSNFAGRGGPCRHNDHYWLQGNYVGVGPGAASHRDGVRWTNLKPLVTWTESVERGIPPVGEAETLRRDQRIGEALWLGIRRADGVDLDRLARRLGSLEAFTSAIDGLVRQGWVERVGDRLVLTEDGLLFADSAGEQLLVG